MAYRVLFISDISLSPFTTTADRMLICPSDAEEAHVKQQLPPWRREMTVRTYRGYDLYCGLQG